MSIHKYFKNKAEAFQFEAFVKGLMGDTSPPSQGIPEFMRSKKVALKFATFLNTQANWTARANPNVPTFLRKPKNERLIQEFITAQIAKPEWDAKPRNNSLAIVGDSIVYQNFDPDTGSTESRGTIVQALRQCGQRLILEAKNNYGVSGATSVDSESKLPAILASGCGVVIDAVGTNDRNVNSTMTANDTMASALRRKKFYADNKIVAIFIVPRPRGNATYPDKILTGDQLAYHIAVRNRMKAEMPSAGCAVYDSWPLLMAANGDVTAQIKEGVSVDGLHFPTIGAMVEGPGLAATIKTVVPRRKTLSLVDNPSALSKNLTMQGTGGSVGSGNTGQMADNFASTKATGTTTTVLAYSKVVKDGKIWQQIGVSSPSIPTAAGAVDLLRQTGLQATAIPGVTYEVYCAYEIDAGVANILSFQLGYQVTSPTLSETKFDGDRYQSGAPLASFASAGEARSPRFVMPAGATALTMRATCYLDTVGIPAGTFRITALELRPVMDEAIIAEAA